jgi:predicted RNA-binding Zn-ribbon protein involved in translation (DUF1610 family)
MDQPNTQLMPPTDVKIAFKCPGCLRRLEAELDTVDIDLAIEPCEEHGQHVIVALVFNCPNCNAEIHAEMVAS